MQNLAVEVEADEVHNYDDLFEITPVNARYTNNQYKEPVNFRNTDDQYQKPISVRNTNDEHKVPDLNIPHVIDPKRDVKREWKQLKVALAVVITVFSVVVFAIIAAIIFLGIREGTETNGGWSVWADWTDCSATCNAGVQTRQRQCNSPEPSSGGQYCQGSQMDVALCNKQKCPQIKVGFVGQHSASANEYGQKQKVIFATVYYNYGGGYDNQTGIFTAPEPGTYLFSFYILSRPGTSAHVALVVGGKYRGEADAAGYTSAGNSDVVYLKKGEQVWIETSNFQSQYYISAYKSQFIGALLE